MCEAVSVGIGLCVAACSSGSGQCAVGYDDGAINVLANRDLQPTHVLQNHSPHAICALDWTARSAAREALLVSVDRDGLLITWETTTFTVLQVPRRAAPLRRAASRPVRPALLAADACVVHRILVHCSVHQCAGPLVVRWSSHPQEADLLRPTPPPAAPRSATAYPSSLTLPRSCRC